MDELPCEPSGKFLFCRSDVAPDYLWAGLTGHDPARLETALCNSTTPSPRSNMRYRILGTLLIVLSASLKARQSGTDEVDSTRRAIEPRASRPIAAGSRSRCPR